MKFEEFSLGQIFETEEMLVTEEMVYQFASFYDPQTMHLGIRAPDSLFNHTIASGFQTLAIGWGLWIRTGLFANDGRAGLSLESAKWYKPVFIGDKLHAKIEIIDLNPTSNEKHGVVSKKFEIVNQSNDIVASYVANSLVAKTI